MADVENIEPFNMPSIKLESVSCEEEIHEINETPTEIQIEEEIYETPSKKRMCYAANIKTPEIKNMSPRTLITAVEMLKESCHKKDKIINRYRVQQYQKKKIDSLQNLLCELRTKSLLSAISSDIVQVLES